MTKLLLSLLVAISLLSVVNCGCYENWSRCTPQTGFWTGILWKSCPDYCRQCKGRASGGCQRVKNKECSGGYQCQCSGGKVSSSSNLIVKATCNLGL